MADERSTPPPVRVQVVGPTAELIRGDKGRDDDSPYRDPIDKPKPPSTPGS